MNIKDLLKTAHRLMELGEYEQAESCYTELILQGSDKIEVYNNRGSARFALRKFERAIGDYTQAIRINPRIDYPHFNRANCKVELADFDGAIRDYERALQFNPTHAASFLKRALAYQRKGNHAQAIKDFAAYLDHAPEVFVNVYAYRSDSYFALGKEEAGIADIKKVLASHNGDKSLINRLIDIYLERDDFKEALDLCKEGLAVHKEDLELKLRRAEIYIAAGAPALAWTDLGNEQAGADNAHYLFLKGKILNSLHRVDQAIECFEKSLEIDEKQLDAWIFLGGLYLKKQAYDKSFEAAKSAQALDKDYPESYLLSAKASYETGKPFAAIADLERYENRGGNLAEAFILKGFVLIERSRYTEAGRAFDKALKRNPELPDAYLGKGNVFLVALQYAKALAAFEKALELSPTCKTAIFNKGVALQHMGKLELALECWEKAAELHHPKAEAYLRRYR